MTTPVRTRMSSRFNPLSVLAAMSVLAGALLAGPALAADAAVADKSADVPAGYTLVWADEFDEPGLPDPRKWAYDTAYNKTGWFNNEKQYYAGPRAENAVVRDGVLVITARKEGLSANADWGGQAYSSARLFTRGLASWTYGFFEIRARLPCGLGTWPAIWMLGTGGAWPDDGELDIMEHQGRRPTQVSSAVHVKAAHGANPAFSVMPLPDACRNFHRYQMHWTREAVTFGVDGFMHMNVPNQSLGRAAWPFDAPQYLLLNLAIGGDLGGPVDDQIFPLAMEVDYVRVYQSAAPAR